MPLRSRRNFNPLVRFGKNVVGGGIYIDFIVFSFSSFLRVFTKTALPFSSGEQTFTLFRFASLTSNLILGFVVVCVIGYTNNIGIYSYFVN